MFGSLEVLPTNICQFLSGEDLESKQHDAMMLLTVSEDNWPHIAMVSVGEVIAISPNTIRIAMWPNTSTDRNLKRTGRATLILVLAGKAYYIRLFAEALPDYTDTNHIRSRFTAKITGVREDVAKYAEIVSGVQIQLHSPEEVVRRWMDTLKDLRQDL